MAITLRQESQTGATTKGDSLTFSELDNNFIDLLTNKIQPLQVDADTGSVTVGEAQSNGVFKFIGGSNITTSVAQDSAGNAEVTINGAVLDTQVVGGTDITVSQPDSAGAFTVSYSGSAISNVVEDTTPQLGGALDAQTNNITNLGTINTHTIPGGTGTFALTSDIPSVIDTQVVGGTDITVTQPDSAGAFTVAYSGSAIDNVVEDTTPQLGGNLDVNGNDIVSASNGNIDIIPNGTGKVTFGGKKLNDMQLENYKETIHALSYAATITPDVANGNVQKITLTGNVAFGGFSNAEDGQSLTLIIEQDGTGNRAFSESLDSAGSMLFAGGTSTLSTAGGSTDIMSIVYAGGVYYASLSTNFS